MIAIISDVHGNWAALQRVLEEIDYLGIEKIINLGDTAGYYPFVNECCEALRERGALSLLGNHDFYLVRGLPCHRSRSASACLEYQRRITSASNFAWLAGLPTSLIVDGINCVHGGWSDHLEEYFRPRVGYFDFCADALFVSGHTHVPTVWFDRGKRYCNPGSVGQPRDGDARASFAVYDGFNFEIRRVRYDPSKTQGAMQDAGFPAVYYENLEIGSRIGGGVDRYEDLS
jgi:predicted phosphodiesterase